MKKRREFAVRSQSKWGRFLAVTLAAALAFQGTGLTAWAAQSKDTDNSLDDLNSRYSELEKEQKKVQQELSNATSQKNKQTAVKSQLDNQMSLTKQQIANLNQQISLLDATIKEEEELLSEKQDEVDTNYQNFKLRMRAIYMTGKESTLGLILGSDSFADFLTRAEVTSRVAEHDTQLVEMLQGDIADIKSTREQLDENEKKLDAAKGQVATKQGELSGQIQQVQNQIQDIAAQEAEYRANKAQIDKEMAAVQAEIDKIYQANKSEGSYDGGQMAWPLPGFSQISSPFGYRFGGSDFHTGTDITGGGCFGKNIVAAADGKVIHVQKTYTPGVGYGLYLIIDHGGGISTLYGHTSEILVSEGQQVSRGQVVARVGQTGWATGPHLHFEVRVNGKPTNPMPYLK